MSLKNELYVKIFLISAISAISGISEKISKSKRLVQQKKIPQTSAKN